MRKNNPRLKGVVDEFVKSHMAGTSFGNTLMRRRIQACAGAGRIAVTAALTQQRPRLLNGNAGSAAVNRAATSGLTLALTPIELAVVCRIYR
jgi:hypothetical protein